MDILIIFVNYRQATDVCRCIVRLRELNHLGYMVHVCVCDNSGDLIEDEVATKCLRDNNVEIAIPEFNLGYLGGANFALMRWVEQRRIFPTWTFISNADLELPDNLFSIFKNDSGKIDHLGLLSPKVITDKGQTQNPHLLKRLTRIRLFVLISVFSNSFTGALYLWLHQQKACISARLAMFMHTPREHKNCMLVRLYAAHGSIFALKSIFFERGGTLRRCSFMYAEEIFVAEQLRQLGLESYCDETVEVFHREHKVTGVFGAAKRSKWFRESYIELLALFYRNK